ncbi:MAG: hypothetical protein ACE5FU_14535 [Nitrospinota bacterium]
MEKTLTIVCPCCQGKIIADTSTGQVLLHEQGEGEANKKTMEELVQDVHSHGQKIKEKFEQEKEAQKNRKDVLDDLFKKTLKDVDKDGKPPKNIFDMS